MPCPSPVNHGAWYAAICPLIASSAALYGGKRAWQIVALLFALGGCISGVIGSSLDGGLLQKFNSYTSCAVNSASISLCDCTDTVQITQYMLTSASPFYTHSCDTILLGNGFLKTLRASVAFCSLQVILNALLIVVLLAAMIGRCRRTVTCNFCVAAYHDEETPGEKEGCCGFDWLAVGDVPLLTPIRCVAAFVGIWSIVQLAAGFSSYTFFAVGAGYTSVTTGAWWAAILPFCAAVVAAYGQARKHILAGLVLALLGAAVSVVACGVDGTTAMTFNAYKSCVSPASDSNCVCSDILATTTSYLVAPSSPFFSRSCASVLSNTGYLGTIKASTAFSALQVITSSALAFLCTLSLNRRCVWWLACNEAK